MDMQTTATMELLHALKTHMDLSANLAKTFTSLRSKKRGGRYQRHKALALIASNVRSAARKLGGDMYFVDYSLDDREHAARILLDEFERGEDRPRKHKLAQQGDEFACSCGARWDASEGRDAHP